MLLNTNDKDVLCRMVGYVGQIMANLQNSPKKSAFVEAIVDFLSCFRSLSDLKVCRTVLDVLGITVVLFRDQFDL